MRLFENLNVQDRNSKKEIKFSLSILVLVAMVPLLIFGSVVAGMFVNQKKSSIAEELSGITRALQVAVDRELDSQFTAMKVLASDVSLDTGNLADFQQKAIRALNNNDEWLSVGLLDPRSRRIIIGAPFTPSPSSISLSPSRVEQVVLTHKPVIAGTFNFGRITKSPIILLLSPVMRGNEVRYVLGVALNPKLFSNIFAQQRLNPSWTGAIVDADMMIAGRSRNPERYVGRRATSTLADRIASSSSSMFNALNQEGSRVYTVFSRSPLTFWTIAIGVPAADVEGPIRHILLQLTAGGGVLIICALIITGMVGRWIVIRYNIYEQSLRESEARFRLMADSAPVLMWMSDTDRLCTWVNRVRLDFTGRTMEQEMGKNWTDGIHPDDFPGCYEAFNTAFDKREPFTTEFRLRRADGQYRWILDTGIPLYVQNIFKGYIGSGTDISERKQAEFALRESESKYRIIFNNGIYAICIFDSDTGEILDANDAHVRIYGYSRDELISGINVYQLSADPELSRKSVQNIVHSVTSFVPLRYHKKKNGTVFPVEIVGGPYTWKGKNVMFVLVHDITDRKQIEEALRNSEERYRRLFEMESDSVLILDCETGRFMDVNSAASGMYGYSKEEFLHLRHTDLSAEPEHTEKSITDNEEFIPIRMHHRKDGTVFPVEIAGSYFEYHGRRVHAAAIRDITERVRTEENLIVLNQKLRALGGHFQSVQEQERLAISRDIHDDVGQSLTVLKLDLTWLEQKLEPFECDIAERMNAMRMSIDQITSVIQRIAADLRPPLLDNQGLSAALEWHVNEFKKRSGIECFTMINEDTDIVSEETATAVMRIVQESLTNIARHARATEVGVSLCARDGNLVLEISDNGCGVTPEQIAAQNSFGLMGMQERARLCRGELEITGESGCGTIMHLTIPLCAEERTL